MTAVSRRLFQSMLAMPVVTRAPFDFALVRLSPANSRFTVEPALDRTAEGGHPYVLILIRPAVSSVYPAKFLILPVVCATPPPHAPAPWRQIVPCRADSPCFEFPARQPPVLCSAACARLRHQSFSHRPPERQTAPCCELQFALPENFPQTPASPRWPAARRLLDSARSRPAPRSHERKSRSARGF